MENQTLTSIFFLGTSVTLASGCRKAVGAEP